MIYVVRHIKGNLLSKGTASPSQPQGFSIYKSATTFRYRFSKEAELRRSARKKPRGFAIISFNLDTRNNRITWRINGQQNKQETLEKAGQIKLSNSRPFQIGRRDLSRYPEFLEGQIAEILVYKRSLATDEISKIEQYLLKKWKL